MSVKHVGLVLDHLDAKPALKLVAIILADHADSDGLCWPSYRRISQRSNMDERTVRRHVKALQDMGVITKLRTGSVIEKDGKAVRITNAYRVNEVVLLRRGKLSTSRPVDGVKSVHLEVDKKRRSRGAGLSTKSSFNHQTNHQYDESVDNSREPVSLDDVLGSILGGDS